MTSTELGYLSGVTSNIQDQLNGKALSSHSHDAWHFSDIDTLNNTIFSGPFVCWFYQHFGETSASYWYGYRTSFDINSAYDEVYILANPSFRLYRNKVGGVWSSWYENINLIWCGSSLPSSGSSSQLFFLKSS